MSLHNPPLLSAGVLLAIIGVLLLALTTVIWLGWVLVVIGVILIVVSLIPLRGGRGGGRVV